MLLQQINQRAEALSESTINDVKALHRAGIRRSDKVLIVGAGNIARIEAMARLVGPYGAITVLDSDPVALADVFGLAENGQFRANKPFTNGHPAFDFRSPTERTVPVNVLVQQTYDIDLPYTNEQFDDVWVESTILMLSDEEKYYFEGELKRVSRRYGRAPRVVREPRSIPPGAFPELYMLLG